MPDDMKGMKKLLIDHLYSMIAQDTKSMKELEKEFGLSEDKLERLIKTFLNKWLVSPYCPSDPQPDPSASFKNGPSVHAKPALKYQRFYL